VRPPLAPEDTKVRRWVLITATLGYALVILDVTAMNVVAPVIQRELDAPISLAQWVISAYTLFLAALLLLGGSLADRYGRRFILGTGGALFAAGSLGAALSPEAVPLIVSRAVQGTGSALMVPAGLGLIAAHYPALERGRAIGLWSGISGLVAVLGPLLGGILSDVASWRWLFLLYVPAGLLLVLLTILALPRAPVPLERRPLDLLGTALVTAGLFALVYALIRAGVQDLGDPLVLLGFALGAVLLVAFLFVENRSTMPIVKLGWFRDQDHAGAHLVTFLAFFALGAGMLFVPMRLLAIEDWRPAWAGAAMLPTLIMIGLFAPRFGSLMTRTGAKPLVIGGCLVAAAGYIVLAFAPVGVSYFAGLLWGLVLVGLGMAMLMAPLTVLVLATVEEPETARSAGLNNAFSRLGALFAIALAGLVALGAQGPVIAQGLDELGLDEEDQEAVWQARKDLAHAEPPDGLDDEETQEVTRLYQQGFLAGYRAVQGLMAAAAALGAVIAALLLSRKTG
jgi:EmrB/QacA subfamily drug resistance transporter